MTFFGQSGMTSIKKVVAFTLAETLVVMGIIGIVSALTLPNLNSSTGEKEKVAKVKKLLQNLDDAVGRATAVYGPMNEWCPNSTGDSCDLKAQERITEFLKVSKTQKETSSVYNRYTLADGSEIFSFWYAGSDICFAYPNQTLEAVIQVDIDGFNKGKNLFGYDRFAFVVTDQGVFPDDASAKPNIGNNPVLKNNNEFYSTAWVVEMGNMDYLKTTDGKTCPNKKVLDWTTNTSCK